jgi:uncharacterized membrane protein HdeD (DUF308 family)
LLGFIVREEGVGKMNKKFVNDLTREWWSVALRGVVAVLAGVVVVVSPIPHLLLSGIGSVILSVIIVVGPAIEARILGRLDWLACLYLVGFGLLLVTLAARLRTLSRGPESTPTLPAAAH